MPVVPRRDRRWMTRSRSEGVTADEAAVVTKALHEIVPCIRDEHLIAADHDPGRRTEASLALPEGRDTENEASIGLEDLQPVHPSSVTTANPKARMSIDRDRARRDEEPSAIAEHGTRRRTEAATFVAEQTEPPHPIRCRIRNPQAAVLGEANAADVDVTIRAEGEARRKSSIVEIEDVETRFTCRIRDDEQSASSCDSTEHTRQRCADSQRSATDNGASHRRADIIAGHMRFCPFGVLLAFQGAATSLTSCGYAPLIVPAKDRHVTFEMQVVAPASLGPEKVRLWVPVPLAGDYQECGRLEPLTSGGQATESYDDYGNRILYLEGAPPLRLSYAVSVRRFAATAPRRSHETGALRSSSPWLASTERAPLDAIRKTAVFATSRTTEALGKARILFDMAVDELETSGPLGSRSGNLTEIVENGPHDAFDRCVWLASALRSIQIPAYVEHGYRLGAVADVPLRLDGPDAWVRFEIPGMGFLPADPARAYDEPSRRNFGGLDEDRIRISRGREIRLVPPQDGPLLARFAMPYAEREGRPVTTELEVRIAYRDSPLR